MSQKSLRQDLINATFIGAAAAGAFLIVAWNRLEDPLRDRECWLESANDEYVPAPQNSANSTQAVAR